MKTKRITEKAETGKRRPESEGASARMPRGARDIFRCSASLRLCSLHQTFDLLLLHVALPRWFSGFPLPLSALVLVFLPLLLRAANDPSLFPDGRQRAELRPQERNPFAQQAAIEEAPANPQEGASEEARLRRILRAMKIGGVSGSTDQRHVLLGSLILKPGTTLPPILKNQSETLRVLSVGDGSIVLAFVERDPSVPARQIALPLGIKPEVTQLMFGEAFEALTKVGPSGRVEAPPLTIQGAEDFLQSSKEANLRNMADRDVQMMGVITNAENAKKGK